MVAALIALNKFGLGARPDDRTLIADDPKAWLVTQIDTYRPETSGFREFENSQAILKAIHEARASGNKEIRKNINRKYRQNLKKEIIARVNFGVKTDTPFAERMVYFWSNHFTTSGTRKIIAGAIPAYEREAVRPNVFGKFGDMLAAVTSHPVMLTYLDNAISIGANSKQGKRRKKTMNENLAREILELHTLSVNGGYTQKDVMAFAKALTGWSHGGFGGKRRDKEGRVHGKFEFIPQIHEPGSKSILGKSYPEAGVDEVRRILKDLAAHPSTARFLATKMAAHFIADDPPEDAVRILANTYIETGGDLGAMSRQLVEIEAIWQAPLSKVKTPYELMISVMRAMDGTGVRNNKLRSGLEVLGHSPFMAGSPQGWSDQSDHWLTPVSLMRRIEWVRSMTAGTSSDLNPSRLLEQTIGPIAGEPVRQMVAGGASPAESFALLFASAEFQRR
jgi:uncharacterized protein (DUF1800 family)